MKSFHFFFLILVSIPALCSIQNPIGFGSDVGCHSLWKSQSLIQRSHTVSISDFGAKGDGIFMNTQAFKNAILYASSLADRGGVKLYVPAGKWLTGSFNLTDHITLFLENGASILGAQEIELWPVISPLPSYGRGREYPGGRHISLIHGTNLTDVVITGNNGTIDGQGSAWWKWSAEGLLNHTRPHLLELINCDGVVISNITFINSPYWNIHPVYSRNIFIERLTILAPENAPNTDGIDPDSCTNVCIQDCYIRNGDDVIAIKSGWDEYGIAYGQPSNNIFIRRITGQTTRSAGIAFGSESSGGISEIYAEDIKVVNSKTGVSLRTGAGRGGYMRNIFVRNVALFNVGVAIAMTGMSGDHADSNFDGNAIPVVRRIVVRNVSGNVLDRPGRLLGLAQLPFRDICISEVWVEGGLGSWKCSDVEGFSSSVYPPICSPLLNHSSINVDACSDACSDFLVVHSWCPAQPK